MDKKIIAGRSIRDIILAFGPSILVIAVAVFVIVKFVDPAPPSHPVMTSGDDEGDYLTYAKQYQEILKEDGIDIEIRESSGSAENLKRLMDDNSDVDVGFVQDGLGDSEVATDLESLGSLYYEPVWVFSRIPNLKRFSQLAGKRVAIGSEGSGTRALAIKILRASGVDHQSAKLINEGWTEAVEALRANKVDAAIFLSTAKDPLIEELLADRKLYLMNFDQAEGLSRQMPYLHHLVLPHGAIDLKNNLPSQDVHLVAPTATLVVRDDLHPALTYLLLKAADEIHSPAGLFEVKDEFPKNKDHQFPLNPDAKSFYKNGMPFWQRYLPFWMATLIERFIFFVIPVIALLLPMIRTVPRIYAWRVRSRIFRHYGELKFLENQIKPNASYDEYCDYLTKLDGIEDRVNHLKVPLDYANHIYSLREHIDFVRGRLGRVLANLQRPGEAPAAVSRTP